MLQTPFYDPNLSYQDNYEKGPFGKFADRANLGKQRSGKPDQSFLGLPVWQPFGIPAGPLLNARYCEAAFQAGFDLCVYKTVRTRDYPCHPAPNVVPLAVEGDLTLDKVAKGPVVTKQDYTPPLTITNSFGVPSMPVDVWQADMEQAVKSASAGQLLIGSFQGTKQVDSDPKRLVADYAMAARLVVDTGAPVIEANLSCPNEGTSELLCFDIRRVSEIVSSIRQQVHNHPLLLKLSYFTDQAQLAKLVQAIGDQVDGLSVINTIPTRVVNQAGQQALPGEGRLVSGACGDGIRWAGLKMIKALSQIRQEQHLKFVIIGVGGVMKSEHFLEYRRVGADAVMSATGAMWNANLAQEIWERRD